MKTFLTKSGILASNDNQSAFFTNLGEFIRECSQGEFKYLTEQIGLVPIEFKKRWPDEWEFAYFRKNIQPLPKWHFLFSTENRDDTNYQWGTSCNGGGYANYDRHNYFVRLNGDKVEFAFLTESYSSAEFHQTWNGSYQDSSQCDYTTLIDVEGDWQISERQSEPSEASLLQGYGQICKLEDLFQPAVYIPSRDAEDTTPQETPLTFAGFLGRWRTICQATGKTVRQLAPKIRRQNGRILGKGRRR